MAHESYQVPVSVKGIIFVDGNVWLRQNERDEWELPGGKINEGEQPTQTVVREMKEELGFDTEVIDIVHAHLHVIGQSVDEQHGVLVLSYLCQLKGQPGDFELVGEAGQGRFQNFPLSEVETLNMPQFYKEAIATAWCAMTLVIRTRTST